MKDMLNLSLRLALICAIAAMLLAKIADLTAGPIAAAELRAAMEAVEAVLPAYDNAPDQDAVDIDFGEEGTRRFYVGKTDSVVTGVAFKSSTKMGYSGKITVMMGVEPSGKVRGVRILQHAETPGLGANYDDAELLDGYYLGRDLGGTNWKVKNDGGDLDAMTGATITARALADAVENGLRTFNEKRARILSEEVGQ